MTPRGALAGLLCLALAGAFRPNPESGGIAPGDFTDASITERGALRAVAWFLERNPPPGQPPLVPGSLENLEPLTASQLFKAYYKAEVSAGRLLEAIQEIIEGNNQVEIYHLEDSSFHFHCEEIARGVSQLRLLRDAAVGALGNATTLPALQSARSGAGKALHVLQQFYSNSNWAELGRAEPYGYLVDASSPAFPAAPPTTPTCKDCTKQPSGPYLCQANLLVSDMITSGYKLSDTCRKKPKGKCGHGGRNDVTQNVSPTGGINKETSDPQLSPHHQLHQRAAQLAVQATRDFFVGPGSGLLAQVGSAAFRKLFNLAGYSLTFAIDTTGSMSEDIAQVQRVCLELIRRYVGSADAPHNYVLVPFNDPDVGPVYATQDVGQFEAAIARLKVDGGGDCPELALSGLELALRASEPRSKIFLFSDAGAKDQAQLDQIKVLLETTRSQVNAMLTGYCAPSGAPAGNVFEELAAFSGGYFVLTTKSQLPGVLGVMELALNAAPVTLTRAQVRGSSFSFPVDEALSELSVSVRRPGGGGFSIALQLPSGSPPAGVESVIDTSLHKVLKLPRVEAAGTWTVLISPSGVYEVEIGGKSLLDVSVQILEQRQDLVLPIQGRPVRGTAYIASAKLLGESPGTRLDRILALDSAGQRVGTAPLNQSTDANGNLLAWAPINFQLPATVLGVEGLTGAGQPFSRLLPEPLATESVQVRPLQGQNGTLLPGSVGQLAVLVVNDGAEATFTFSVADEMGLLQSYDPPSRHLGAGETVVLTGTFAAPASHTGFSSSIATFTARSSSANNYVKIPILVVPEDAVVTDEKPPVHGLLEFSMPCVGTIQHDPDCARHVWSMRFYAVDAESSVTVRVKPNPSGLTCRPRGASADKGLVCDYRWTCCSPYTEVLVSDENGNADAFTVDYRNPRPTAAW
ncbi:von Willebrand factor A domain-containing protein 7 [Pelodiscus sinensis]|uniref:von Willebrand factor A domain-containing protein 7 n=1 Tax=Pelodiscus sinensis TaxID=13735 RepID=UPI003F6B6D9E